MGSRAWRRGAAAALAFFAVPAWGGQGPSSSFRETEPAPAEFLDQARSLFHLAACAPGGEIPIRFDGEKVLEHCRKMEDLVSGYREGWLSLAKPYLSSLRPRDLPRKVVYPFGGGDLVSALAAFPDVDEYTLMSLEPAGDPRAVDSLDMAGLDRSFALLERNVENQFKVGHSRTDDMTAAAGDRLPAQLLFALVALVAHGHEPVSLRYMDLLPSGELSYLTPAALAAADKARRGSPSSFRNMELSFRPSGAGKAGRVRVLRHFALDLGDGSLRKNPGLLSHLEDKGPVAAMTKAASYLLWEESFSLIRDYLLKNMVWMISDSTGIPERHARAAGFVQDAYGRFEGPFLKAVPEPGRDFAALWKSQPLRRLPFPFGYPDRNRHLHMLVTRRPGPAEAVLLSAGAAYTDAVIGFSVSFSSPSFVAEASPGAEGHFLRLQNFRFDEGQKTLNLDEGSFLMEFLSARKGTSLSYGKVRADWSKDEQAMVDGFPCRGFSGFRGTGATSPFSPDTGILCPGASRDVYIMTYQLSRNQGTGLEPPRGCREAAWILSSIRLDPAVFGR
ncbi:MAG: hypothetical protein HZB91_14865 [Elusimicrobia bacterium]|nr:hypothetical protein [Elusimicrobiota bacterium]